MEDLKGLFRQPPLPPGSIKPLNPRLEYTPCAPCGDGVLPELYRCISTDDCESSSLNARQAKHALIKYAKKSVASAGNSVARAAKLKAECNGWRVFAKFTDASWSLMSQFVDRAGVMLVGGHLRVMTGVGEATNASLEDIKACQATFCGHCFNVGCIKTPSMEKCVPFLLEGTSSMYSIKVTESTPRVTVHLTDTETGKSTAKTLDMPSYLSALASTVLSLCAVVNMPNGGRRPDWGWPMETEVAGWVGKTVVSPSLDSDPKTPLSFYHRIMYMGWPCTTHGDGSMPVEEGGANGEIAAGCHPFKLTDQGLRCVNAGLPTDGARIMAEVMEEAVPPQAPLELVQKIGNLWLPCRPLEKINTEAVRQPGVKYHRVVCMESPCAPEYLSIVHEARSRLAKEANRINDARADSDGSRLYSLLEGTDDLLCIDVMDAPCASMTIVDSIQQAMHNLGWPQLPPSAKK